MEKAHYIHDRSGSHWMGVTSGGALEHILYPLEGKPLRTLLPAPYPVRRFSLLLSDDQYDMLLETEDGLYHAKYHPLTRMRREVRIAGRSGGSFPYLYRDRSGLRLCSVAAAEGQNRCVIRIPAEGAWKDAEIPFPDCASTAMQVRDAAYAVSGEGRLYGLFHRLQDNGEVHTLDLLELEPGADEAMWRRLFASRQPQQRWRICLSLDRGGRPHAAWSIRSGAAAKCYYANDRTDVRSCSPLKIHFGECVPQPYFLWMGEQVFLLYIMEGNRMSCARSPNRGADWSAFSDIRLAPEAKLRIVQGMEEGPGHAAPWPVLGTGYPHLRSLGFFDVFPLLQRELLLTDGETLSWMPSHLSEMFDWIMAQAEDAAHKIRRLETNVENRRLRLEELMACYERLQAKERSLLAEIHELQNWAGAEPISLTFI
ncbi:MAG: carboxylesterase [Paenibacillus dendritiformis]|uniref:carboxylesterase n=1 Tax=uncultured Paenibacillus sp. TaxID=227322 RepID=UPI0025CB9FAD|nr:carboxylesterase [uncultured Paenibacillus sp.]MDU5143259.1 carboxylesterase [Paenibacillus dendritiformis]